MKKLKIDKEVFLELVRYEAAVVKRKNRYYNLFSEFKTTNGKITKYITVKFPFIIMKRPLKQKFKIVRIELVEKSKYKLDREEPYL